MKRRLVTIGDTANVFGAAAKMKTNNVSSLLVTGKGGKIESIITAKDLVYKSLARKNTRLKVRDLASKPLKGIESSADLTDAAKTFRNVGVKHLVVYDNGKIVGMISERDVVSLSPSLYDLIAEEQKAGFFPEFRAKIKEAKNKLLLR